MGISILYFINLISRYFHKSIGTSLPIEISCIGIRCLDKGEVRQLIQRQFVVEFEGRHEVVWSSWIPEVILQGKLFVRLALSILPSIIVANNIAIGHIIA